MDNPDTLAVSDMLTEALGLVGTENFAGQVTAFTAPKKAIVIFVDDESAYDTGFMQQGMNYSDMIVALEVVKAIAMKALLSGEAP